MLQSADGSDLYQNDENMVQGADAGDIQDPDMMQKEKAANQKQLQAGGDI